MKTFKTELKNLKNHSQILTCHYHLVIENQTDTFYLRIISDKKYSVTAFNLFSQLLE